MRNRIISRQAPTHKERPMQRHTTSEAEELRRQLARIDLADLVQRDGVQLHKAGGNWQGLCPFHAETTPSFTIFPNGRGWFCFGACQRGGTALDYIIDRAGGDRRAAEDIARGLETLGIADGAGYKLKPLPKRSPPASSQGARGPGRPRRQPDQVFDYHNAAGAIIYQVCRWDLSPDESAQHKGKRKLFIQRQPDGASGHRWSAPPPEDRLLYRLPQLLTAPPDEPIFIVEGEKAANRAAAAGLTATTASGGAGRWPLHCSHYLAGHLVIILPDNDDTGRAAADLVASHLRRAGAAVKIVDLARAWPELPHMATSSNSLMLTRSAHCARWPTSPRSYPLPSTHGPAK